MKREAMSDTRHLEVRGVKLVGMARDAKLFYALIVCGLVILGVGVWFCTMGLAVEGGETVIENWLGVAGVVMFLVGLVMVLAPFGTGN
jgi:protein-S-isoprenylcysteine O-methyltransferase Ste14